MFPAPRGCRIPAPRGARAGLLGAPLLPSQRLSSPRSPPRGRAQRVTAQQVCLFFGIRNYLTFCSDQALLLLLPFSKDKRCPGRQASRCCCRSNGLGHIPRPAVALVRTRTRGLAGESLCHKAGIWPLSGLLRFLASSPATLGPVWHKHHPCFLAGAIHLPLDTRLHPAVAVSG